MNKRIIYTRFDGCVSICSPAQEAIRWMTNGGFWLWHQQPRGFAEIQIERQIAEGIPADAAARHAKATMHGGCVTAEALEIIRDRDCTPHGTAIELWDLDDIPTDLWFREAWRRSQNGGPISVDLKLAKPIQWKRARYAVETENKRRSDEFELMPLIEVDWDRVRERIRSARVEDELRLIWPL